ncbi:hypothetical protein BOTBODRAFT_100719 [Botryobasidium botryosum FD-172 SS1]|uniref:RFX-type winged-helix domain-containing protein n=1 Tax=Botryobasidium botryosum (strain FD-172 SS1) TaxID=930990 RepID=A0A067MZ55_BOTB1|nr:hypothetical protein BOTBODRAFT_100719 [Botryobasidium botryosum FD-172 SS1]
MSRNTAIRRARTASSPYPKDQYPHSGSESVRSSSSEAEDGPGFYSRPSSAHSGLSPSHSHESLNAGAFGRMTLNPEQALEQLASNVRTATTTSASDRAKQIFVQAWFVLNANYAPYPEGNVPRQGLYNSYRRVCDEYGIPHINTATLGKAIRLCFPSIKTRRLGVRGNSKYHYCGIRPATAAEAEWLHDYVRRTNNQNALAVAAARNQSQNSIQGGRSSNSDDEDDGDCDDNVVSIPSRLKSPTLFTMDDKTPTSNALLSAAQDAARMGIDPQFPSNGQMRSRRNAEVFDPSFVQQPHPGQVPSYAPPQPSISVRQLPNFPSIDEAIGASSSPHGVAAREVWLWFEEHLNMLLETVRSFQFDQFEIQMHSFWANLSGDHREVVHAPALAGLMAKADAIVYDEILEILRTRILLPVPQEALNSLRQLADKMEKVLLVALESYGHTFVEPKVELGARFGHLVLRLLDIFQITQALNTVLSSPKQLEDMRRAWRDIDFESVRNQSALVCNCRHEDLVQLLEVDFVAVLDGLSNSREPVRDLMAWADNCCDRLVMSGMGVAPAQGERPGMSSRSVLIRWGYVTSQIMRDLTIRSDPAFGAFQILKLFLDDWIALNVLRSVALSTNSVAASVEPVMHQQYLTLSPMTGHEPFPNGVDARAQHVMDQTPTASSMLATLNSDPFVSSAPLDAHSSQFHAGGGHHYASLHHHYGTGGAGDSSTDGLLQSMAGVTGGLTFPDFPSASGAPFDMSSFATDISLAPTPASAETPSESGAESKSEEAPEVKKEASS